VVYRCRKKKCVEFCAIKSVDKTNRQKVLNEVMILNSLRQNNVLQFHTWYETRNHIWLIMEYCTGGDLLNLLMQDTKLPESTITRLGYDLLNGLQFIHSKGIVCCDLKPSNMLLDENGTLKFADFGLAQIVGDIGKASGGQQQSNKRGTPCYMAPELFHDHGYHSFASDFWALGCVLYEMAAGRPPFVSTSFRDLMDQILHREWPPLSGGCSDAFGGLLGQLLCKDQFARISWGQLLESPFWQSVPAAVELPPQPRFDTDLAARRREEEEERRRQEQEQEQQDAEEAAVAAAMAMRSQRQREAAGSAANVLRLSRAAKKNMAKEVARAQDDASNESYSAGGGGGGAAVHGGGSQGGDAAAAVGGGGGGRGRGGVEEEEGDVALQDPNQELNFTETAEEGGGGAVDGAGGRGGGGRAPSPSPHEAAADDDDEEEEEEDGGGGGAEEGRRLSDGATDAEYGEDDDFEDDEDAGEGERGGGSAGDAGRPTEQEEQEEEEYTEEILIDEAELRASLEVDASASSPTGVARRTAGFQEPPPPPPPAAARAAATAATAGAPASAVAAVPKPAAPAPAPATRPITAPETQQREPPLLGGDASGEHGGGAGAGPPPLGGPGGSVAHAAAAGQQERPATTGSAGQQGQRARAAAAAGAGGSRGGGEAKEAERLIFHESDQSVKPIVRVDGGSRKGSSDPGYDARALPFAAHSLPEVLALTRTQKQLEAFLTEIYRSVGGAFPVPQKLNTLAYFETLCVDTQMANILINSRYARAPAAATALAGCDTPHAVCSLAAAAPVTRERACHRGGNERCAVLGGGGSLMTLFVKMGKALRTPQLKVRLASTMGLLIRHATYITHDLGAAAVASFLVAVLTEMYLYGVCCCQRNIETQRPRPESQGLLAVLCTMVQDKHELLRRKAAATLGELLFYISTQQQQQQNGGSGTASVRPKSRLD
jgi:serine/threonine-protein kinase ULK4